jgi:trans-aconitate methyltransferase
VELLATAVDPAPGIWADFGAGTGTFTRALARILGPPSSIHAVDADARALEEIRRSTFPAGVVVSATLGDFMSPAALAELGDVKLDGILAANSLHFVRDAEAVLERWITRLADGGRIVVIEYDRRAASRWVPYPMPPSRLAEIAKQLGLSEPRITATRPSEYSGELYVAAIDASSAA